MVRKSRFSVVSVPFLPHGSLTPFGRFPTQFSGFYRNESGIRSIKSVGQGEKARYEEAEKREESFPFQIVGMGNELKGER